MYIFVNYSVYRQPNLKMAERQPVLICTKTDERFLMDLPQRIIDIREIEAELLAEQDEGDFVTINHWQVFG